MLVDDIELHDWKTKNSTTEEKRLESIKAYHLYQDTWYPLIKDLTFETIFYDEIPDELPFDKCMVRWENKSPKDSKYWGPVSTKEEVERVFNTSLRCKTNPGKIYCFRPWIKMYDEYRCFWNGTLRAVGATIDDKLDKTIVTEIIEYINIISDRIPYIRCVFDICKIREGDNMIFKIIEFNSWETLSGATSFDWTDDTEIFYDRPIFIYFKSPSYFEMRLIFDSYSVAKRQDEKLPDDYNLGDGNYVILKGHIYISNDIWLGKFTMDFKSIKWTRGIFRFSNIETDGTFIRAGGIIYTTEFQKVGNYIVPNENLKLPRYGLYINSDREYKLSLDEYCNICIK